MSKLTCLVGLLCFLGLGLVSSAPALAQQSGIVVNGQPLSMEEVVGYGIQLPAGRYWYDHMSGFWGVEGGPYAGQVLAGLPLGGPLQPNASNGDTGVFINGREIHLNEYLELLQIFGEVPPGRYWLNADLIGGLEGQPATFSLNTGGADSGGGGGGGTFEDRVGDFCAQHGGC